jgi:hypothetical protein
METYHSALIKYMVGGIMVLQSLPVRGTQLNSFLLMDTFMISTMLTGGRVMVPAKIEVLPDRMILEFGYNKDLLAEVKLMKGRKWLGGIKGQPPKPGERKAWQVDNCERNDFQLKRLMGQNVYAKYDLPLIDIKFNREQLRAHQRDMVAHMCTRLQCIIAAEMGTGKSLSAIEAMEWAQSKWGNLEAWWVAPKTALTSVRLECRKWQSKVSPSFHTYDSLKKELVTWPAGQKPPRIVIFDESSRIKTPTAQRSQAAAYLAEQMRKHWGEDGCMIVLMSGSPAPKSPVDWYWQAEIARPGFFKAGTADLFKYEMGVFEKVDDIAGVTFPKFKTWRTGKPGLCNVCGEDTNDLAHMEGMTQNYHLFVQMADEVSRLAKRMRGFAMVKLKSQCTDLPDKVYRTIHVSPTPELKRSARLVQASSRNAIEALTRLRELSDGFQYLETDSGQTEVCEACHGKKTINNGEIACPFCDGIGRTRLIVRETQIVTAPKLKALTDLLEEEFEDDNRIVLYAGFKASIDLVHEHLTKEGWTVIRVDGRGWASTLSVEAVGNMTQQEAWLEAFQNTYKYQQKIAFLGHPGSAGMGVTLTASRVIFYYSNDFNFESRIQSEDRIHRLGMDVNKGALIIDFIHLPSDALVLKNLQAKKEVQAMSLGDIIVAMEQKDDYE